MFFKKSNPHNSVRKNTTDEERSAWQTAVGMGVGEALNKAGDKVYDAFMQGVNNAKNFLQQRSFDTDTIDEPKFIESTVKKSLAEPLKNEIPWVQAHEDIEESMQPKINRTYQSAPMLSYIKARDIDDYSKGEYTTTKYLDKNPNPDTVQFQKTLNHFGIKDNFGNSIKEDGLFGPKTMQAADNFKNLQNNIKGIGVKADNKLSNETNESIKAAELTVKPAFSNQTYNIFADPQTKQQKATNINSTIEVIKSGGSRLISKIQEELNKSGYTDGNGKSIESSGIWDNGTQVAAQNYLKDNADKKPIVNHTKKVYNTVNKNLEEQMTPSEMLVKKMSTYKGTYFSDDASSDAVYWAQKALNNLGYSDASNVQLPLDGKLTENTQYAITEFQQKSGLNPTGALDAKTLSLLNKPFQLNGKNLLYGNFGETIKQTEVVNVAENMLSKMKPNTMVEIPYKNVATSAVSDSGYDDSINDEDIKKSEEVGTNGYGLNLLAMAFARLSVTIQYVEDTHGNSGILFSIAPGAGLGVSASASGIYTHTNADKIEDLTGISTETGGSVPIIPSIYLSGGSEYIIGKDYTGYDISGGLGFTPPYFLPYTPEMHSDVSFSFLINNDYTMLQYYSENGMYEESTKLIEKIQGDLSNKYEK